MNIRTPASGKAARIAKAYLKEQGIELAHSKALELVARLHGYKDAQAMQADVNFQDPLALKAESSHDYVMTSKTPASVWITAENISVYVRKGDEGVAVDLYAINQEDGEPLTSTWATYQEAEEEQEEEASSENSSFQEAPVDWSRVAEEHDLIGYIQFDKKPRRTLTTFDRFALRRLAETEDLSVCPGLSETPAFQYVVPEGHGQIVSVENQALKNAVEVSPGLIKLADGRLLQLLEEVEDDEFQAYSPSLDIFVK